MKQDDFLDFIDDILEAPKYPDGTIKDTTSIIEKYKEKWEEVFEAETVMGTHFNLKNTNLTHLAGKYLNIGNIVKIKARKGKIIIEEIE